MKNIKLGKVQGTDALINGKPTAIIKGINGIEVRNSGSDLIIEAPGLKNIKDLLDTKVDKVPGKQLSQEDFTNEMLNKLTYIEDYATNTIIESELSDTSENAIQNRIVKKELDKINTSLSGKQDKVVGTEGQVLMFDTEGRLIASEPPTPKTGFLLDRIIVSNPPNKTSYEIGERFDPTGILIHGIFQNGAKIQMIRYSYDKVDPLTLDDTSVTVTVVDGKITKTVDIPITVTKIKVKIPAFNNNVLKKYGDGNNFVPGITNYNDDSNNVNDKIVVSGDPLYVRGEHLEETYTSIFSLRDTNTMMWSDGTNEPVQITWSLKRWIFGMGRVVYGFELNLDESNPDNMISYIENSRDFSPAKMNYDTGIFEFNEWNLLWFITNLKVVMMGYDGQVKYELDIFDYKKKKDGSPSDVENQDYPGNVMVGIPTVWIKVDTANNRRPKFYFSQVQIDGSYHAYAHTDANGTVKDFIYIGAYASSSIGGKLRSISKKQGIGNHTDSNNPIDTCRNKIKANGNGYDLMDFSTLSLLQLLLMLIGKSTDTQKVFGRGYNDSDNGRWYATPGSLNDKGLFYGYNIDDMSVKTFGIENLWGQPRKWVLGLLSVVTNYGESAKIKYKLTKGRQDGSTADDYNFDGTGYIETGLTLNSNQQGFIKDMKAGPWGLLPVSAEGGSSTTYFCDYYNHSYSPTANKVYFLSTGNDNSYYQYDGIFSLGINQNRDTTYQGAIMVFK